MKLGDFLKQVEGLDPNTILCVAEVDEAFGSEIEQVEILDNARQRSPDAADTEAVELGNGDQKAVVIRVGRDSAPHPPISKPRVIPGRGPSLRARNSRWRCKGSMFVASAEEPGPSSRRSRAAPGDAS